MLELARAAWRVRDWRRVLQALDGQQGAEAMVLRSHAHRWMAALPEALHCAEAALASNVPGVQDLSSARSPSPEAGTTAPLQGTAPPARGVRMEVPPATPTSLRERLALWFPLEPPLQQRLTEWSGGALEPVLEVLRTWARQERLVQTAEGWGLLGELQLPRSTSLGLEAFLADLSPRERRALHAVALGGNEVRRDEAEAVLGVLGLAWPQHVLQALRDRQLVWFRRGSETVRFLRSSIRDALRTELDASEPLRVWAAVAAEDPGRSGRYLSRAGEFSSAAPLLCAGMRAALVAWDRNLARLLHERLLDALTRTQVPDDHPLRVSAAVGRSMVEPTSNEAYGRLITRADALLATGHDDPYDAAAVRLALALQLRAEADSTIRRRLLEEAWQLAPTLRCGAVAAANRGIQGHHEGEDGAAGWIERSTTQLQALGLPGQAALVEANFRYAQGDIDGCVRHLQRMADVGRAAGVRAQAWTRLGIFAIWRGDDEQAQQYLVAAIREGAQVGDDATARLALAELWMSQGRLEGAAMAERLVPRFESHLSNRLTAQLVRLAGLPVDAPAAHPMLLAVLAGLDEGRVQPPHLETIDKVVSVRRDRGWSVAGLAELRATLAERLETPG